MVVSSDFEVCKKLHEGFFRDIKSAMMKLPTHTITFQVSPMKEKFPIDEIRKFIIYNSTPMPFPNETFVKTKRFRSDHHLFEKVDLVDESIICDYCGLKDWKPENQFWCRCCRMVIHFECENHVLESCYESEYLKKPV